MGEVGVMEALKLSCSRTCVREGIQLTAISEWCAYKLPSAGIRRGNFGDEIVSELSPLNPDFSAVVQFDLDDVGLRTFDRLAGRVDGEGGNEGSRPDAFGEFFQLVSSDLPFCQVVVDKRRIFLFLYEILLSVIT